MKRVLWCVITSGLLLATAAFSQTEVFVPANDISFTVATERSTYRVGEQIDLKYEIVNISNAAVYIPREWEAQCPSKPHVWAWFETSSGKHLIPGYAGSCSPSPQTVTERIRKEAVLLKPGERLKGTVKMDTTLFGGLKSGSYRLEATLSAWTESEFSPAQQSEMARFGAPFIHGDIPASTHVRLTP